MAKKLIQVVYKVDNSELTKTQAQIRGIEKDTKKTESGFQSVGKAGSLAFASISGAIAALGLVQLGRQVIHITSEFQKFQAVLTNTLGSRSAANAAMKQIQDFAAKTPFSVQELTASFVKLANQGFKPTADQMRKLGDIASSTGKGFDQLTEAIIDAQTGEFERLKEFGIRASKQGDQVTFAFKGVETQTKFTADAIRQYILSLGDMGGVSGSMAAISETLGGQISNLGDSWDKFMRTLGDGNKGALKNSVSLLGKALELATDLIKTEAQSSEELKASYSQAALERMKAFNSVKEQEEYKQKVYQQILDLQIEIAKQEKLQKEYRAGGIINTIANDALWVASKEMVKQKKVEISAWQEALFLFDEYKKETDKTGTSVKALTKDTDELTKAQKELLKQIDKRGQGKYPVNLMGDLYKGIEAAIKKDIDAIPSKAPVLVTGGKTPEENDDLLDEILGQSINFLDDLLMATIKTNDAIFLSDSGNFDRRMALAGDNERRRQEIELEKIDFDKQQELKLEAFQRAQDEKEKERIIKRMKIDVFATTLKALAKPIAPNWAQAGIAAAFGLAQIGLARAIGFKDGVIDLQGPGTGTSDSINARLSKGESVMTADETARSYNLLTAIRENKIDDKVLNKLKITNNGIVVNLNDERIVKAIQANRAPSLTREGYTIMETYTKGNNLKIKQRAKLGL